MKSQPCRYLAVTALALTILAPFGLSAQAADYKIDPAHSFVEFKTVHLGYSWLAGRFNKIDGTLKFDPSAGADAQKINLTIDAASVDTNHAERDKHLRSEDFFNVAEFPTVTFSSTGFDGNEVGGTLTGDLTLHGVTKSVSFPIIKIGEGKDPWGGYRAGFEGEYTLVRKDFGMGYNLGPAAENVELELYIEGIRQ